jgi:hypothetical protein
VNLKNKYIPVINKITVIPALQRTLFQIYLCARDFVAGSVPE